MTRFLALALCFWSLSAGLTGRSVIVDGSMTIRDAQVVWFSDVEVRGSGPLQVRVLQVSDWSNGVNRQSITPYRLSVTPEPTRRDIMTDPFGNIWNHLTFDRAPSTISIESIFHISSFVDFRRHDSQSAYPLTQNVAEQWPEFLEASAHIPSSDSRVVSLANSAVAGQSRAYLAVLAILESLSQEVSIQPDGGTDQPLTALSRGAGSSRAISRLAVAMLRAAGFPVRSVTGLAIDAPFFVGTGANRYEFRYPRGERQWLEVYLPDRDWVPIDVESASLALPPVLVRGAAGPEFDHGLVEVLRQRGSPSATIEHRIFAEARQLRAQLDVVRSFGQGGYVVLMPSGPMQDRFAMRDLLDQDHQFASLSSSRGLALLPATLSTNHPDGLSVSPTLEGLFAQAVDIDSAQSIAAVELPLHRQNFSSEGEVWVEVLSDADGLPNRRLVQSRAVAVRQLPYSQDAFRWIRFPLSSSTRLASGRYWIVLRSSTRESLFWQGVFGNPYGHADDTRHLPHDTYQWDRIPNVDLALRLSSS